MCEQNQRFPSLHRLTMGVLLYGLHVFVNAFYTAFHTGKWMGLSGAVLVMVGVFRLSFGLRGREKWAWWVALGVSVLMLLRFLIGLSAQLSLYKGISHPTATLYYDPFKIALYTTGFALMVFILFNTLHKGTRAFVLGRE